MSLHSASSSSSSSSCPRNAMTTPSAGTHFPLRPEQLLDQVALAESLRQSPLPSSLSPSSTSPRYYRHHHYHNHNHRDHYRDKIFAYPTRDFAQLCDSAVLLPRSASCTHQHQTQDHHHHRPHHHHHHQDSTLKRFFRTPKTVFKTLLLTPFLKPTQERADLYSDTHGTAAGGGRRSATSSTTAQDATQPQGRYSSSTPMLNHVPTRSSSQEIRSSHHPATAPPPPPTQLAHEPYHTNYRPSTLLPTKTPKIERITSYATYECRHAISAYSTCLIAQRKVRAGDVAGKGGERAVLPGRPACMKELDEVVKCMKNMSRRR